MRKFLNFIDGYIIFMIGFTCGLVIGYFHAIKIANKKYELGYLNACKDVYKGKPKYNLVKNDDGTVIWKRVDK